MGPTDGGSTRMPKSVTATGKGQGDTGHTRGLNPPPFTLRNAPRSMPVAPIPGVRTTVTEILPPAATVPTWQVTVPPGGGGVRQAPPGELVAELKVMFLV